MDYAYRQTSWGTDCWGFDWKRREVSWLRWALLASRQRLAFVARRSGRPIDGTVLSLVDQRASDPIDSTASRMIKRQAGGTLTKDTVSLLFGRILRPVICKRVKTPTSTHWREATWFEERKLLSSGRLLEVRVVVGPQRGRKLQLNPKGRTAKGLIPTD